ncbi:HlyD family secretion protein [Dyadobacter fermentans]|uniref:Secretion protein HlyD family protein n=1 Tax=Dyadobacter fermentans (strain ATCC 700827 / DSM 18053 / CIP 107007 / KCTC 52180 / NS114) TaxID=471854 RepID=C6W1B4_DYAFD|nr:HlyD family efflux transporter periplasmic adaptor subunit [Dyadobacter fermentans]ACT91971.1 secretion protein HlyD family protein [Dyadobacter fermentans DSM 18053]
MDQANYKIPLKSFDTIYMRGQESKVRYWFYGIMIILVLGLFLPWTQNIKAPGSLTSLYQEQRPQDINSPIPGRIARWFVKEGDFVQKGDTIVQISEIKEDYLDPKLVNRTQQQVQAKKDAIEYYKGKAATATSQIQALQASQKLKIQQLKNKLGQLESKLASEQADLEAANNEFNLAKDQYERQEKMQQEGLVSKTQLQQRNTAFRNAMAKRVTAENKVAQTKQEILITQIEQNGVEQEYAEKISKTEGERLQSLSNIASGEGEMAKLENQVTNYTIRNGMYIITAPQDGQIVQASKAGIGEILKDGERITVIVPTRTQYAVEMYVRPVDLPLISVGQKVRFLFDGFPAIIFSGWPENSYGTFGGKVVAFEHTISPNGLFRVLVAEDASDRPWPQQLKLGTGAQGIALLKDVPVWYELWRNINGFPPDYYVLKEPKAKEQKK